MLLKTWRCGVVAVALLAATAAGAETLVEPIDGGAVEYALVDEYGSETERWWGAAGAVICGGARWVYTYKPELGMNPYVLAAGIGGCALAALDILTTP